MVKSRQYSSRYVRQLSGLARILAALAYSTAGTGCGGAVVSPSSGTDSVPPVLSVPITDLGQLADFFPFGWDLGGHLNPAYEFQTSLGTAPVRAVSAGVVVNLKSNPAPDTDLELHLRPTKGSIYLIVYDHLVAPQVTVGQSVTAGQVLGRVGPLSDPFHIRNGRVELQINRHNGAVEVAVCPRALGTAEFNAAHDAALAMFPGRGTTVCVLDTVQP